MLPQGARSRWRLIDVYEYGERISLDPQGVEDHHCIDPSVQIDSHEFDHGLPP